MASGCGRTDAAALHVVLEDGFETPLQLDALEIHIAREDGAGTVLATRLISEDARLPYSLNIVAGETAPRGTPLRVTARALLQDVEVAQVSAGAMLDGPPVETLVLRFSLDSAVGNNGTSDGGAPDGGAGGETDGGSPIQVGGGDAGQVDAGTPPVSCAVNPTCPAGFFCKAGELICVAQKAQGQSCGAAAECTSNFCADGFCCNQACSGPCDVCNATAGTCTFATAGSAGSPSCGRYACSGTSAACTITCSGTNTGCNAGFNCVSSVCMPKASSLVDNFQGGALNTTVWMPFFGSGAVLAQTNGRLQVTLTQSQQYAGVSSNTSFDLLGSQVKTQVESVGDQNIASLQVILSFAADANHSLAMSVGQNNITVVMKNGDGMFTNLASTSFSMATGRYLRIREAGGTVFFERSGDNVTWVPVSTRATSTVPFALTSGVVELAVGTYENVAGLNTSAAFEALNP
ncbi:MAG: hypothetical protein ACT4TC_24565 [Myxococcaceae bacterium]